jgi:class 3 adenylate cyclase
MIALLAILSYMSYERIGRVNSELIDITAYLVPIGDAINTANLHALEQEIHLEHLERLCEIQPLDTDAFDREFAVWKERSKQADDALDRALRLANEGVEHAATTVDIIEFARLGPTLEAIKEDNRRQRASALEIVRFLQQGDKATAHLLGERLDIARTALDQKAQSVSAELNQFSQRSIHTAAVHEREALHYSWIMVIIAATIGLLFAAVVTLGMVRPVKTLLAGTSEVERGNLTIDVPVTSADEVGELTEIFNAMVRGIRETKHIKATFGQYVDPRIVDSLIAQTAAVGKHPVAQEMTVFFSDIAGFSKISEKLTPEGLVKLINQYLTLAAESITRSHGVIDKFIGDAVVAYWGPPFADAAEHAETACRAALEQMVQVGRLNQMMPDLMGFRQGLPQIEVRMGLATGALLMGNIGSEQSKSYTVMGEVVGLAEQLEGANKIYGTQILITQETQRQAAGKVEVRELDLIRCEGSSETMQIFELLGLSGGVAADTLARRDTFSAGLRAYRSQDWNQAQTAFEQCLDSGDDAAAKLYLDRVATLRRDPPGEDWTGVWS